MVKIPLTTEQIKTLIKWRDKHKDLVRACMIPFPECEIISENGIKIKAKQDHENKELFHFTITNINNHVVVGRFDYILFSWIVRQSYPQLAHDSAQDCVSIWGTVMSYIINFEPKTIEKEHDSNESKESKSVNTPPRKQKRPQNSVLYLNPIKFISESKNSIQRKYTPPSHAFPVRGHYRKIKSGKIIYIHPYEKNTGKEKDKRNKIVRIVGE